MALHTVTVNLDGVFQNADQFTGLIRFRLCRPSSSEDGIAVYPERWQEVAFHDGSVSVQLVPNAILSPENTWYEYEIHDAARTTIKNTLLQKGCVHVPNHDCSFLDIEAEPVEDTPISAEVYASQAKSYAAEAAGYAAQTDGKRQEVEEAAQEAIAVMTPYVDRAEAAQVAAETAQAGAVTAKNAAQAAQTAAETAQGKAEDAQEAAEAAANKIWTAYATAESVEAADNIDMSSITDGGLLIVTITD